MEEHSHQHTARTTAPLPVDAVVAVTYICNSRCTMCDFWKETRLPTVTLEDFRKLPPTLRDINVSGGEPFLHPQIVDIVRVLHETCPAAQVTISTNGFLTDQILKRVRAIQEYYPEIGIRISLDGVGDAHQRIRRIPQGYDKCLATLRALKASGVTNLGLAYTMTHDNVEELNRVRALAEAEGVQFTCAFMHTSDFYFGGKDNRGAVAPEDVAREFDALITHELRSWQPKRWARAYFAWGLRRLAIQNEQVLPSRPGTDFFFLDPFGNVMPSVMHPNVLGNLSQHATFAELWSSETAQRAREAAETSPKPYWLICTARTAMRRNLLRVGAWIVTRKLGMLMTQVRIGGGRHSMDRLLGTHA